MTNWDRVLVSVAIESVGSGRELVSRANHRQSPASRKAGDATLEIKRLGV